MSAYVHRRREMRWKGRGSGGTGLLYVWGLWHSAGFFIFSVRCTCVCVCVCGLYERHITLRMTLLDGDGPLYSSTLMQSPVNTLNQAAKEEADYPSSTPRSSHPLVCSFSLALHICFCFNCFTSVGVLISYLPRPPSPSLSWLYRLYT